MASKTADEVKGFEYDWLGVDADGHVGFFSTAGAGHAPPGFLHDTEVHDAGIEAMLASPPLTGSQFFPDVAVGLPNAWKDAAERGIYAFDSDPNGGPYRLVAAPVRPASRERIPVETLAAASRVRLQEVSFAELEEADVVFQWPR